MQTAASVGFALWVVGALLIFVIPGGLWSDVPGWALFGLGGMTELAAGLVVLARRIARGD